MRVLTAPRALRRLPHPVVAIGTFDGVHRAHQAILREVVRLARQSRGTSAVISFDPHPQHVLRPGHLPPLLTRMDQRLEQFGAAGIDVVRLIRFTPQFARHTPETFFRRYIVQQLHAACVVVGSSFGFGRGRQGTLDVLRQLGATHGVVIRHVPNVLYGHVPISSTRIRAALGAGQLTDAARMLGRPCALRGPVTRGSGRGAALGFPTANIDYDHVLLPPIGVYAVRAQQGRRRWRGVANVGQRPTFGRERAITVEVHVFGATAPQRGQPLTVEWLHRLRGERAFPSAAALRRQIARDIVAAQQFFRRTPRA